MSQDSVIVLGFQYPEDVVPDSDLRILFNCSIPSKTENQKICLVGFLEDNDVLDEYFDEGNNAKDYAVDVLHIKRDLIGNDPLEYIDSSKYDPAYNNSHLQNLLFGNIDSESENILRTIFGKKFFDFHGAPAVADLEPYLYNFWKQFIKPECLPNIQELDQQTTLLISNLLPTHDEEDIRELFENYKDQIIFLSLSNNNAVITFNDSLVANDILSIYNYGKFDGNTLYLCRVDGLTLSPVTNPRFVRIEAPSIEEALQIANKYGKVVGVKQVYEVAFDNEESAETCINDLYHSIPE